VWQKFITLPNEKRRKRKSDKNASRRDVVGNAGQCSETMKFKY